jgi:hypothetical protein
MGLFMRKYGYKLGIHIGLGLFSTGAILFWPSAKYEQYGMYVNVLRHLVFHSLEICASQVRRLHFRYSQRTRNTRSSRELVYLRPGPTKTRSSSTGFGPSIQRKCSTSRLKPP